MTTFAKVLSTIMIMVALVGSLVLAYREGQANPTPLTDKECDTLYYGLYTMDDFASRGNMIILAHDLGCPFED